MNKMILFKIKENKKDYEYFKKNSYWIKELNRNNNYKEFKTFIKEKYHLFITDKISNTIDNIDLISNVINVLN